MPAPRTALDIEIPSDVRQIERVVELVTARCRELRLPAKQCSLNVPVALSEALSNAILRGNGTDPSQPVRVRAIIDDRALVVDVVDQGPGFDLGGNTNDPTTPENILREEGRGVFLMRKLMDSVEQFHDHGHVVRMTLLR